MATYPSRRLSLPCYLRFLEVPKPEEAAFPASAKLEHDEENQVNLDLHDLAGATGAAILLGTYFALQVNRIRAQSMLYSQLNAVGSGLIATSLLFDFNLSAFVIETAWFFISCIGAIVTWRQLKSKPAPGPTGESMEESGSPGV
ncbi:MAG: hypothetical protein AB8B50_05030 [Pirellulaceae bacterium]